MDMTKMTSSSRRTLTIFSTDDIGGEFQEIVNLTANRPSDQPEEESERAGLAVRLLGRNRQEWAKPSIEMLESVQDRGVPEDQIRDTAEDDPPDARGL